MRWVAIFLLVILSGCGGSKSSSSDTPDQPPGAPGGLPIESFTAQDGARFGVQVFLANLQIPWAMAFAPDGRLFFTERPGRVRVYQNGRVIWENVSSRIFKSDEDRIDLTLQPGSNEFLIRVHASSRATLGINYESAEPVNVSLPDPLDTQRLAERLAQAKDAADATSIPPEFAKIDWEKEWKTGDPARGRQLFDSLGCSKCHAATADSPGGGGPSLAEAGKRFTIPYVVESVLLPSKVVSPLFRFTVIRTNSGDLFGGLVISETPDKLDLRLQDTTLKSFNKSDINARKQEEKSPMPQGLVRLPQELKDLLAYVMRDAEH